MVLRGSAIFPSCFIVTSEELGYWEPNSAPSPRPLSHVANFHTHVSTPETLMPDGRKIWVL